MPVSRPFDEAHEAQRSREPKDGAFVKLGSLRQSCERKALARVVEAFEYQKRPLSGGDLWPGFSRPLDILTHALFCGVRSVPQNNLLGSIPICKRVLRSRTQLH
jgi:hypothetical protein